ncbi:helix-turn-helix domain-containing protein, partial [Erysipelothrix rhusiopathiae]|nr:helix-turn-helix domain-containing protein [Erysipelothrix rhusiopathiae]
RIQRDFKNSLTRLDNCEVANEVKTIKAGSQQLDAIYKLIEHKRMQIQIEIENAAIAKRLFSLLKERYQVEIDLTVVKKQKLK